MWNEQIQGYFDFNRHLNFEHPQRKKMIKRDPLYFQSYEDLFNYCYSPIKINEDTIIQIVDSDFSENFAKKYLSKSIDNRYDSIFYTNDDVFDISLKRSQLNLFRHVHSNYEEVLNQLTLKKVKAITSLEYVCLKDLLYYNDYGYKYKIRIKDEDEDEDEDEDYYYQNEIPIRKAIYIDIKTAISDRIDTLCVDRIYYNYKILENKRLKKQEELNNEYVKRQEEQKEQERCLEEAKKLQENITNLERVLHEKYISFNLDANNPSNLPEIAKISLEAAIIWGLICPTCWVSLMFFLALILAPTKDSSQNFLTFIFAVIFGLPYLVPLIKFFILKYLYLIQKPVYLSRLQEYRKSCYLLLKEYDNLVYIFVNKYDNNPSSNKEYTLNAINQAIQKIAGK